MTTRVTNEIAQEIPGSIKGQVMLSPKSVIKYNEHKLQNLSKILVVTRLHSPPSYGGRGIVPPDFLYINIQHDK